MRMKQAAKLLWGVALLCAAGALCAGFLLAQKPSPYLPITRGDTLVMDAGSLLIDGEEVVKTDFTPAEKRLLWQVIGRLAPKDLSGKGLAPGEIPLGGGPTLMATGEGGTTTIRFGTDPVQVFLPDGTELVFKSTLRDYYAVDNILFPQHGPIREEDILPEELH